MLMKSGHAPMSVAAWLVVSTSARSSRRSCSVMAGDAAYSERFADSGSGPSGVICRAAEKANDAADSGICRCTEDIVHVPAFGSRSEPT